MENQIESLYPNLKAEWARSSGDRPYVAINMVATIDGKIVTGIRGEPVQDLGSVADHRLMRVLQGAAQGVLIGAGSQRSSKKITYPPHLCRFVVTRSGGVDFDSRFFQDDPTRAVVVCPEVTALEQVPEGIQVERIGAGEVEWQQALEVIRGRYGVSRLLVEGGSEVNGQLLRLNCVDELFLTVAPKIRLGENLPTYAGGPPLVRDEIQRYSLISSAQIGDEMFLRYRRIWN